ncbi:xanthine dehydrogenase accessory protein XdhC [Tamlana sp. 2201CG12-4]|uniref:xanthine dehydrogenase accessory protein XdhC n=1 Tax=Tamlana sp. 2201CG12-4 TaxID=3112582 RepID=UPI002DB6A758|nr:xanthine dehydrogenase accessory protein XdhC [Tamlana sp. 2201CG12-4]MEC3908630.1 xanthine dehydrogenase accessory protein XdhC [Tamlana sp. 2201CG12-4]
MALVTVTKVLGSAPCNVASRMVVDKNKSIYGTIGGGKLEHEIIEKAIQAINENNVIEVSFTLGPKFEQCCGGKVDLLIEPMNQSPELFLFGAGHIGVEISKLLEKTPFQVNLIDSREGWFDLIEVSKETLTSSVNITDFKTFRDAVKWGDNCYVLVMTHDHGIDLDIIAMAIPKKTKYLGLIGSKTKCSRFHKMLVEDLNIKEGMEHVVCPVGLGIGGNTPKEIAIDVVAQLLKEYYKSR